MTTNTINSTFLSTPSAPVSPPVHVGDVTGTNAIRSATLVICAFGIAGITLTVIVLSRKHMSNSTNVYLMALAVSDLVYLLIFASKRIGDRIIENILLNDPIAEARNIFEIYDIYASHLMQICLLASIWLTVILAIERWIAICQPFLASKFCTVFRSRIYTAIVFLFAFLCRLPSLFEFRIDTHHSPNQTSVFRSLTKFSSTISFSIVYPWIIDVFISSIIPFILLFILNAKLIVEVHKSTSYLQKNMTVANNRIQREEIQIAVMLISVIIVFFICQVLQFLLSLLFIYCT